MPSSKSLSSIHCRCSTHSRRSKVMWVGGPPNPMQPIRVHSRAMVTARLSALMPAHRSCDHVPLGTLTAAQRRHGSRLEEIMNRLFVVRSSFVRRAFDELSQ